MVEVTGGSAALFMVTTAVVYDVISATNSSPQTTEINAAARADTLMKWVNIGLAQAMLFVAGGAFIAYKTGDAWWAVLLGGMFAAVLLWLQYVHAKNSGLAKAGAPTESYGMSPAVGQGY